MADDSHLCTDCPLAVGPSDDAGYFWRGGQLDVQAIGFAHPHSCGLIVAAIIVPIGVDLVVAGQQPQDSHTVRCRFGCRLEILAVRTDNYVLYGLAIGFCGRSHL